MLEFRITDGARLTQDYAAQVRKHLDVSEPQIIARLSGGALPQCIELAGPSTAWLVLSTAAIFFLKSYISKLGELAAEGSVAFLKKLRRGETDSLLGVVEILAKLRLELGSNGSIVVGVDLPSKTSTAVLSVRSCEPLKIALQLSRFIAKIPELEKRMAEETAKGHAPFGNILVRITNDDSLDAEWIDQTMVQKHLSTL